MPTAVTGKPVGNDNRGIASKNHAMDTLISASKTRHDCVHLHVAEEPEFALVESTRLDLLSTSQERDEDGQETSASEADDRDTQEGVESGRRAKVDTGEGALDRSHEEEGVQGELELRRDPAEHSGSRETSVSGEADVSVRSDEIRSRGSRKKGWIPELTPRHIGKQRWSKQDRKTSR
jgi:hypothetical protein